VINRINIGCAIRLSKAGSQDLLSVWAGDSDLVQYHSPQTWYARNMINEYTQVTGSGLSLPVPRGGILDEVVKTYTANNVRGQLSYNDSLFRHGA